MRSLFETRHLAAGDIGAGSTEERVTSGQLQPQEDNSERDERRKSRPVLPEDGAALACAI